MFTSLGNAARFGAQALAAACNAEDYTTWRGNKVDATHLKMR
jgi:hypothetical protein